MLNRSRITGLAGAGIWLALALGARAAATPAPRDIRRDATVEAVEKVMPGVVNIATETVVQIRDPFDDLFREFWDPYHRRRPADSQYSLGSGVVIDEAGYLLTNDHVVRRADRIAVKFATGTNVYGAELVASDPKTDLALLRLKGAPGEKFHAVKLAAEDDLLLGETVLALGNPFGLGGSVSRGILSSKSRIAPKEGAPLDIPNWLQTDAPINLGNSGGPLVNLRGELIGINVAVLKTAQGIGFAIPIKLVMEALPDILPTEFVNRWWFGARLRPGANPLEVVAVEKASPADQAGLREGDRILLINGEVPRGYLDFAHQLTASAGAPLRIAVRRGAIQRDFSIRLVEQSTIFNQAMIRRKLGLELRELTPNTAARYGLNPGAALLVAGIEEKGPAAGTGLEPGALITALDGYPLTDVVSAAKRLRNKQPRDRVALDVAIRQRVGNFYVLRQGAIEVEVR